MRIKLRVSMIFILGVFLLLAVSIVPVQADTYSFMMDGYGAGYFTNLSLTNDSWHVNNGALGPDPTWDIGGGEPHLSLIYIANHIGTWTGWRDLELQPTTGSDELGLLRFYQSDDSSPQYWILYLNDGNDANGHELPDPLSLNVIDSVKVDNNGIARWTSPFGTQFIIYTEGHAPVPEPATMLLFGLGLMGLAGIRRKFNK